MPTDIDNQEEMPSPPMPPPLPPLPPLPLPPILATMANAPVEGSSTLCAGDGDANEAIAAIAENDRVNYGDAFSDDDGVNVESTRPPSSGGSPSVPSSTASSSSPTKSTANRSAFNSPQSQASLKVGKPGVHTRAKTKVGTTARKGQGRKKGPQCRKGARVRVRRLHMKTAMNVTDKCYKILEGLSDDVMFYGTVIRSTKAKHFLVQFDRLPAGSNSVSVPRSTIQVLEPGSEEPEFCHQQAEDDATGERCEVVQEEEQPPDEAPTDGSSAAKSKKKKPNYGKESIEAFCNLPVEQQARAKSFNHCWGPNPDEKVTLEILEDDEQITVDPMESSVEEVIKASPMKVDIPWDSDKSKVDYSGTFFKYFFPSVEGIAKKIDDYNSDPRADYHRTVVSDKIKFDRPDHDDPDVLVSIPFALYPTQQYLFNSHNSCCTGETLHFFSYYRRS